MSDQRDGEDEVEEPRAGAQAMAPQASAMADGQLPEPPWRPAARRTPPRVPITREAIIDASYRVLDKYGMEGLSMRRVGEELGVGAASLYWHVHNKDELLQLLFERIIEQVELPEPDPEHWMEQAKEVARKIRAVMHSHRDVARISLGRIPSAPAIAEMAEWQFRLLKPVGLPDWVIALAGDLLALYVGAYAFEESLGLASPTGEDLPPEQIVGMIREYLLALPPERFPHTLAAIDLLMGAGTPDARFEFGLDVLIRGLASYARDAQSAPPQPPASPAN
ncbi:MAG: TetR/AcrR family transcriptional regulator [Acidimicrobiales bacterium]